MSDGRRVKGKAGENCSKFLYYICNDTCKDGMLWKVQCSTEFDWNVACKEVKNQGGLGKRDTTMFTNYCT